MLLSGCAVLEAGLLLETTVWRECENLTMELSGASQRDAELASGWERRVLECFPLKQFRSR